MSVAHASRAIRPHDLPLRGFGGRPFPTPSTTLSIVTSSTIATAISARCIAAHRHGDRDQQEPGHVADDLHQADHPGREPDLRLRDEVRHVALERATGDVRADAEQDHEHGQHEHGLAIRDADEEHDVEQAAEHDVRLAPAPARDRVVADVADGRLDDDPDDRRADADEEHRPADLVARHEPVELEAVGDEQADRGVDRRQAQPVERDPQQLGGRQQRRSGGRPPSGSAPTVGTVVAMSVTSPSPPRSHPSGCLAGLRHRLARPGVMRHAVPVEHDGR